MFLSKNRPKSTRRTPLRVALILALLGAMTILPTAEGADRFLTGQVEMIEDGDTIQLRLDERSLAPVQLAYIDAPDYDRRSGKRQDLHEEARAYLSDLINKKRVIVESKGLDQFNRIIGVVFLGEMNVNLEMLLRGMAEIYYPIRRSPSEVDKKLYASFELAENIAKEEKRGVWALADYISPYQFRRR